MPRDIKIVAENIKALQSHNAPDSDIDQYVREEGWNPDTFQQDYQKAQEPSMTLGGLAKNVVTDIPRTGAEIGEQIIPAAQKLYSMGQPSIMEPNTFTQAAIKRPLRVAGQLATSAGQAIKEGATQAVEHPIDTGKKIFRGFYEHPVMSTVAAKGALDLGMGVVKGITSFGKKAVESMIPKGDVSIMTKLADQRASAINKYSNMTKEMNTSVNRASQTIQANKDLLMKDLDKAAELGTVQFKEKLPEFFRANSNSYGQHLDAITTDLENSGKAITKQEVNEILNKTISNIVDSSGDASPMQKLIDKYSNYQGETVPFRELNQDIRSVTGDLSAQAKNYGKFTEADRLSANLKYNYGEFISNRVKDFKKLQDNYRPVLQAMNKSAKIFKPSQEFETTQGTNFLRNKALEKGTGLQAKEEFLKTVEQGGGFGKGVGNISKESSDIGKRIKALENMQENIKNIKTKQAQDIYNARQTRMNQLQARKQKLDQLLANQKAAQDLKKALLKYTAGTIGAGALYEAGKRIAGK